MLPGNTMHLIIGTSLVKIVNYQYCQGWAGNINLLFTRVKNNNVCKHGIIEIFYLNW